MDGDATKIWRIAQNLLLNAVKYTRRGGVIVGWGASRTNDSKRWMLTVEDTGPGFHAGPGSPLAGALKEATAEAQHVEQQAATPDSPSAEMAAPVPDLRPNHQERGEGIGLSIVKRLCELLDASIELESDPSKGTIFRIVFPRHYDVKGPS